MNYVVIPFSGTTLDFYF